MLRVTESRTLVDMTDDEIAEFRERLVARVAAYGDTGVMRLMSDGRVASLPRWAHGLEPETRKGVWALLELVRLQNVLAHEEGQVARELRHAGLSWERIGQLLGITRQGAKKRYGASDDD